MGRCSHAKDRPNHYDIADSSASVGQFPINKTIQYRKARGREANILTARSNKRASGRLSDKIGAEPEGSTENIFASACSEWRVASPVRWRVDR
jgi:hypothetical protein